MTVPNRFKTKVANDISGESFRMILMAPTFEFDIDTHSTYTDVSGEELQTGGGYTVRGEAMTVSGEVYEDTVNDRALLEFLTVTFSASPSGESYGPFDSCVAYQDVGVSGENVVAASEDFGTSYIISGEFEIEAFKIRVN